MILKYLPPEIIVDKISITFKENRSIVRSKIKRDYTEDNRIIPLPNPNIEPLYMRRDIYKGKSASDTYFFLDYDKDDLLGEVEVHRCERIEVLDIAFDFNDELDSVAMMFSEFSEIRILSEGEVFFKDLKMVLSDKRKMGGEGSTIGYFYCTSDVSHIV